MIDDLCLFKFEACPPGGLVCLWQGLSASGRACLPLAGLARLWQGSRLDSATDDGKASDGFKEKGADQFNLPLINNESCTLLNH